MCVGRAKDGLFAGAMERVAVFVVSECHLDMFLWICFRML